MTGRRRDAAYWRRRIERDHPEIAARLRRGEIPSVRAAAIEAGLIHDPSPLMELRRAWRKASPGERATFMGEIEIAQLIQQPAAARRTRRRGAAPNHEALGDLFALPVPVPAAGRVRGATVEARLPLEPAAAAPAARRTATTKVDGGAPTPRAVLRLATGGASHPSRVEAEAPRFAPAEAAIETPPSEQRKAGAMPPPMPEPVEPPASLMPSSPETEPARSGRTTAPVPDPVPSPTRVRLGMRRLLGLGPEREAGGEPRPPSSEEREAAQQGVAVGQRFVKLDAGPAAWEVLSVFAGPHEVLHVRIANVEEPDTIRVVSVPALTDRGRYRPVD